MMVAGLIEFTFGEVAEIVGYVVLVCVVAALPASVTLAVVGWRRHTRNRAGAAVGYWLLGNVLTMPPTALAVVSEVGWWAAPITWVGPLLAAWYVGRSRPRRYFPTDRPNPWVRQGDPRSGLSWGETTTGQQGER
jgi:hypothetical protein